MKKIKNEQKQYNSKISFSKREKVTQIDYSKLANVMLTNIQKNESKTYNNYTKEQLRTAIKNPKQNEKTLREISQFLYRNSGQYRRLLKYQSELLTLDYNVLPLYDLTKKPDTTKILKSYYNATNLAQMMNIKQEFRKMLLIAWREDCAYGYTYNDNNSFYIMPLDGNYCKISSVEDGVFNFAFDFSYFKGKEAYLEYWDGEFKSKYNTYQSQGNSMRWQELDATKSICIKINDDTTNEVVPPLVGIFEELLDIIDYKSLMKNREELNNYKLIVQKIPLINGSTDINDFAIDLDDALMFGNRLSEAVPDLVGTVVTPMDIDTVEFKKDDTSDINIVAQASSNMLENAGYSRILWGSDGGGSVGLSSSIVTDESMALSVLKQLERWINRYFKYQISGASFAVKFHEMTVFNKDKYIARLKENATLGIPVKTDLITAMGMTPLEMHGAIFLENDILKLHEILTPLSSSYTQSGKGGRPESEEQLSEEGLKTKDANKNEDTVET